MAMPSLGAGKSSAFIGDLHFVGATGDSAADTPNRSPRGRGTIADAGKALQPAVSLPVRPGRRWAGCADPKIVVPTVRPDGRHAAPAHRRDAGRLDAAGMAQRPV